MATMVVPSVALSPQVIANAFVDQYYRILHLSPEQVYRFYQDSSILSRSDPDGSMISVTTLQGINAKIQSTDTKNFYWEIQTADAQPSHQNGVFIAVTGCLSGEDRIRRRFTQTFFLAPQESNGYFVLNDILRVFLDTKENVGVGGGAVPVQVPIQVPAEVASMPEPAKENGHMTEPVKATNTTISKDLTLENRVPDPKEETGQTGQAVLNKEVTEEEKPKEQPAVTQAKPKQDAAQAKPKQQVNKQAVQVNKQAVQVKEQVAQKEDSKKSYASIVIKGGPVPRPVQAPVSKPKPITEKTENQEPKPAESQEAEITNNATVGTNTNFTVIPNTAVSENSSTSQVQGYSIYVRNLPQNATVEQLEEIYKKYGAIKPNGIQVKMHRFDRYFFGFVEFETLEAMQAAIENSPVKLEGRHVSCEEKKGGLTRVTNNGQPRGENGIIGTGPRGPPFREYYQNDNFRAGRTGPRNYSGPNRPPRDRTYYNNGNNNNNNQQRYYRESNGSGNGSGGGVRYEARSNKQESSGNEVLDA